MKQARELIHVCEPRQMRALAAYVRDGRDRVREPRVARPSATAACTAIWLSLGMEVIARGIVDRRGPAPICGMPMTLNDRCGLAQPDRSGFQRLRIPFVPVGVFEENAIAATNCGLAVSLGSKANPIRGAGLNRCPFMHPTGTPAVTPHCTIPFERIYRSQSRSAGDRVDWWDRQCRRDGIKIECLMVALTIGAEEADAQPEFNVSRSGHVPVILEVRLKNFVTVVVLHADLLPKLRMLPSSRSAKGLPGSDGERRIEGQSSP